MKKLILGLLLTSMASFGAENNPVNEKQFGEWSYILYGYENDEEIELERGKVKDIQVAERKMSVSTMICKEGKGRNVWTVGRWCL